MTGVGTGPARPTESRDLPLPGYAAGDKEKAAACLHRLEKLADICAVSTPSMPGLKKAVRLRGLDINTACTFPMPPVDADQTRRIVELLHRRGLGKI